MTTEAWAGTALASGSQSREASTFLARVAREQTVFLDAVSDARRRLQHGNGSDRHLAHAAATHARLTRQFFDAQRSLLRLRADADRELGDIGPVLDSFEQAMTTPGGGLLAWATAEAQLAELLDHWWRIESDEAKAVVDDATARAAVRLHAENEAIEVDRAPIATAEPIAPAAPVVRDNSVDGTFDLLEQLDLLVAAGDLQALLTSLLGGGDEVDTAPTHGRAAPLVDAAAAEPAPSESPTWSAPAHDELRFVDEHAVAPVEPDAFDRFWGQRAHTRRAGRSFPQWLLADVLLPITAVVSLLALALAWIG